MSAFRGPLNPHTGTAPLVFRLSTKADTDMRIPCVQWSGSASSSQFTHGLLPCTPAGAGTIIPQPDSPFEPHPVKHSPQTRRDAQMVKHCSVFAFVPLPTSGHRCRSKLSNQQPVRECPGWIVRRHKMEGEVVVHQLRGFPFRPRIRDGIETGR